MRQVTLRNLLTMASGHESCPLLRLHPQKDWVQGFLESELVYDPGTRFVYNSAATYMLAAVLRKTTGQNVIDFLQERLFLPLGIRAEKWDSCPMGTNIGGWGFWLKTEDLLRFGRLLLNNGNWNGKQLIPADYVKEATRFQIDNSTNEQPDWKLGYGYQFWRTSFNAFRGWSLRTIYRGHAGKGLGAGGHFRSIQHAEYSHCFLGNGLCLFAGNAAGGKQNR